MATIIAVIEEENGTFGISFPDLPGCVSHGRTMEEILVKGEQVLAFHLEGMAEDGDLPDTFRSLPRIKAEEPEWVAGNLLMLMSVDLPGKAQRVNITIDGNLLKRVDHAAQVAGQSRSGFIASAVSQKMAGGR